MSDVSGVRDRRCDVFCDATCALWRRDCFNHGAHEDHQADTKIMRAFGENHSRENALSSKDSVKRLVLLK
jgi:hypothetical protein